MQSSERSGLHKALGLEPDEKICWSEPGLRHHGRSWIGGRIYVTDQRLFFYPGLLMRRRHGVLAVARAEIRQVDLVSRNLGVGALADGGLKPHLKVSTASGETHALTLQRFSRLGAELQALLSGAGSGGGT